MGRAIRVQAFLPTDAKLWCVGQDGDFWGALDMQSSDMASARRIGLGCGNGTELFRRTVRQGLKDFGVATYTRPDGGDGSGGDGFSRGPARVRLIDHTFYHTDMDRPEWVPAKGMEQATQAYAYILDEINKLDWDQVRMPTATEARPIE